MQDVSSIQDKLLFYTVAKGYSTPSISKPTPPLCHTPHGVAYWRELGEPPYHLKLPQKLACPPLVLPKKVNICNFLAVFGDFCQNTLPPGDPQQEAQLPTLIYMCHHCPIHITHSPSILLISIS